MQCELWNSHRGDYKYCRFQMWRRVVWDEFSDVLPERTAYILYSEHDTSDCLQAFYQTTQRYILDIANLKTNCYRLCNVHNAFVTCVCV